MDVGSGSNSGTTKSRVNRTPSRAGRSRAPQGSWQEQPCRRGPGPHVQPRKPDPQWLRGEDTPLLHAEELQPGVLKTLGKPRGSPRALVSSLLKRDRLLSPSSLQL